MIDAASNITDFIKYLPNRIVYALNAQLNPNGNQSGGNDFVYYGTGLKALLNVNIPLYFSATNLVLKDTSNVNFSTVVQLDNVNYGCLILKATNTYPLDMTVQGYMLNEGGMVIDSLFESAPANVIASAPLDVNDKVSGSKISELRIPLPKSKLESVKQTRKICFISRFNTVNQPSPLKFYDYYALDLLLTMDVNYAVNK